MPVKPTPPKITQVKEGFDFSYWLVAPCVLVVLAIVGYYVKIT